MGEYALRCLTILYRGPLASCNYDCPYCPFAKRRDSPEQLRADRAALDRFVDWVRRNPDGRPPVGPVHAVGRGADPPLVPATRSSSCRGCRMWTRVAIQTNLAARLDWLADGRPARLALWATYHPGPGRARTGSWPSAAELDELGRALLASASSACPSTSTRPGALRAALPAQVYLWVNAAEGHTYDAARTADWTAIDPLFGYSVPAARVAGQRVPGRRDGRLGRRRRHGPPVPLHPDAAGQPVRRLLPGRLCARAPCANAVCDCHIGYVHLKRLPLYDVFAGGVLERIPAGWSPR